MGNLLILVGNYLNINTAIEKKLTNSPKELKGSETID